MPQGSKTTEKQTNKYRKQHTLSREPNLLLLSHFLQLLLISSNTLLLCQEPATEKVILLDCTYVAAVFLIITVRISWKGKTSIF